MSYLKDLKDVITMAIGCYIGHSLSLVADQNAILGSILDVLFSVSLFFILLEALESDTIEDDDFDL